MGNNTKVLCIGDSLALPRVGVLYEETWYYLIKNNFPNMDFIPVFRRGITTDILVLEGGGDKDTIEEFPFGSDCLEHYKPKMVILELGIVDCAPRLLRRSEQIMIKRLPEKMRILFLAYLKKNRKRKISNVRVSLLKFRQNIENYLERCKKENVKKVIIIKIPIPTNEMIKKNDKILINVDKYNKIYDEVGEKYQFVKCVAPLNPDRHPDNIYVDGYHPNNIGNRLVFKELLELLKSE